MSNKEDIMKDIDIKLATEISKATVKEMAELRDTKTNKRFYTIAIILMSIICITCVIFTSIVGIKLIDFISNTEIMIETEGEDINAETTNGDIENIGNEYNNNGNVDIGDN